LRWSARPCPADGEKFGRVTGAAPTPEPHSYRFRDTPLPYTAGSLTGRLRQVDIDGTSAIPGEIALDRTVVGELQLEGPFPNPARTHVLMACAPAAGGSRKGKLAAL
jgi:hypothetical protein